MIKLKTKCQASCEIDEFGYFFNNRAEKFRPQSSSSSYEAREGVSKTALERHLCILHCQYKN